MEIVLLLVFVASGAAVFLSWYDCHLAEEKAKEAERELNKWRYIHAVIVRPKRCRHG